MEIHALALARSVNREQYALCAILPRNREVDALAVDLQALDVPVHRLDLKGDQPATERWGDFWALWQLLRQERIEILHQHRTGPFHGKWGCLAAKSAGVPVIIATEHLPPQSPVSRRTRWQNMLVDWMLDRIIVVSEANRRCQLTYAGRRPVQVTMIHNGIVVEDFVPPLPDRVAASKRELGLEDASSIVGTVARLTEQKGLTYFVDMAAQLTSTFPRARFVIVGEGELHDSLTAQAQKAGISDQVIFAGFRKDIPQVVSTFDLFVLPSLHEGFPISILEAMALEKPVVASRVDGIPEAVEEGKTGLLVAPRDSAALAEAAAQLLHDPARAQRLGQLGRRRVVERFSVQVMASKTMALYEELLARKGHGMASRAEEAG